MNPSSVERRETGELEISPSRATQLFLEANVDKSDKVHYHNYHLMYGPFLAPFLLQPVRLLEIGVQDGKSLRLWQRLFPEHELIVGIGYKQGKSVHDTFKRHVADTHVLYTGDQSDSAFLDSVLADLGGKKFDIIIDDGSHVPWHQIFTLEYIFKTFLKEGGLYIIEDIETSYWDRPGASLYGYSVNNAGIGTHGSAVEKLKNVIDVINRGFLLDPSFSVLHGEVDHLISHITFSQNCVIMHKKISVEWKQAEHNTVYNYKAAKHLDPSRELFNKYKEQSSWDVDGIVRE